MTRRGNIAEALNRSCDCAVTDLASIRARLDGMSGSPRPILETHPNLFSEIPVFLDPGHFQEMQRLIKGVETVVASTACQDAILESAPTIARKPAPHAGVFFGYDFHIGPDGPRLIEINSNAGGAFLNAAARDAQIACCDATLDYLQRLPTGRQLEDDIVAMFRREWVLARGHAPLRTIAIVDEDPTGQFLHPEFLLAQRAFESRGITARVADVAALRLAADRVVLGDEPIDLIYNRSTDFYFEKAGSEVLRRAHENDLAVVTPHPRAHALYANKRNLALFSDRGRLAGLGVAADVIDVLARVVPATRQVKCGDEGWWNERKSWFFKPESGFGSRGTYRGDKLTRRVFAEVMNGEYIAQELTPPGVRIRTTAQGPATLKADIRCYVYAGEIQLMAARLYQGQTTNFRTAGGGFAAVYLAGGAGRSNE
jgi:hypothetical protein